MNPCDPCLSPRARRRRPVPRRHQRGASLFIALSALVGLSLAGVAMLRTADTSTLVAGNIGFHHAAVQAADLALETATATVSAMSDTAVQTNNTGIGYYASLAATTNEPPTSRLSDSVGVVLADAGTGNTQRYVIERMCNATGAPAANGCLLDDGGRPIYRITTLVRGPRNTSETVQLKVSFESFLMDCAILTRGTVEIPGTTTIGGTSNCVHSNGNVAVGGLLSNAGGYASAVGSVTDTSKITGAEYPSQGARAFPTFNTVDYKMYADYVFRADGRILNVATNTLSGPYTSGTWNGWYRDSSSPVRWIHPSSTASPAGLYYFEGNVGVGGAVGTAGTPWNVSFIAEGSIQISGECVFSNYAGNASAPQAVNNLFMMARGDIELNGNSTSTPVSGLIITNEELKLNGNNTFTGNLMALNANNTDPSNLDNFIDKNEFSGTTSINYTSNAANSLWPATVNRHQWRTVER